MDTKRVWLAFTLAALSYGVGAVLAVFAWPYMQREWVPHFPAWVGPVSGFVAYWGVFATLGPMILGVLPPYHKFRIIGDTVGTLAFLVNLLVAKNSGSVAFEVGCMFLMVWSLCANQKHHEPVKASRREWAKALATLAGCYCFGLTVAFLWPVNAETQYQGAYWEWFALGGTFVLFLSVAGLETRALPGDEWPHAVFRGVGNVFTVLSCLGQYNQQWLTLCSSLVCLMYAPLLVEAVCRMRRKDGQSDGQ